ncbi:MAG: ribonuclease P protein component [Clostridia bacterium]|nr:ribonuclease P protein component [Clostridia bacterium]
MLKREVLRGNSNFSAVYNKGKSFGTKYVVLFLKPNNLTYSRFAYIASKKVGNSVKRKRAVRLMRESYRLSPLKIKEGYDVIFMARNTIDGCKLEDVKKSVEISLKKSKAISNGEV